MGIIKNINLNLIEDGLEEIIGLSFQTKIFQELHEVLMKQLKINKSSFSSGNISKDIYNKNKIILENERKKLITKINESIEKIQKVSNNIQKIINEYKI